MRARLFLAVTAIALIALPVAEAFAGHMRFHH